MRFIVEVRMGTPDTPDVIPAGENFQPCIRATEREMPALTTTMSSRETHTGRKAGPTFDAKMPKFAKSRT